jgi:hypothetical protein
MADILNIDTSSETLKCTTVLSSPVPQFTSESRIFAAKLNVSVPSQFPGDV